MSKPNLVKISDGSMIDRANVCFRMRQLKSNKSIHLDLSGRVYERDEKGTLRRIKDRKKLREIIEAEETFLKAEQYAEGNNS